MRNLTMKVCGAVLGAVLLLTSTVGFAIDNACTTGPVQCCTATAVTPISNNPILQALLAPLNLSPGTGLGLNCSTGASCTAPLCCTNNNFNGLVVIGCNPINIGL